MVVRLVAAHSADTQGSIAWGSARFVRFATSREVRIRCPVVKRLLGDAQDALPTADAQGAAVVLAADLALLASLDEQIATADQELEAPTPVK